MDEFPKRKTNRLKDYDYSSNGAYFVTICTKDNRCILSKIPTVGSDAHIAPQVQLTRYGRAVEESICKIPGIDQYVIMPNHVHLIVVKDNELNTDLSNDIRSFKVVVSKTLGEKIWQTSYYDHIIRDEKDYLTKAKYIENNPAKWADDELYQRWQ